MKDITYADINYDTIISDIKAHTDIVEIVGETVNLSLKGNNYWGLCPFHQEKTASFSVSRERQRFHCFGCQASGDVLDFIRLRDGVDFKTAKALLAERAGIPAQNLTVQQRKQIQADKCRKSREKEIVKKLQAGIDEEVERLINIEKMAHSVLNSITSERDFDRPAVIWALHTKDRVGYYLDELIMANAAKQLEIINCTRGWDGWPRFTN